MSAPVIIYGSVLRRANFIVYPAQTNLVFFSLKINTALYSSSQRRFIIPLRHDIELDFSPLFVSCSMQSRLIPSLLFGLCVDNCSAFSSNETFHHYRCLLFRPGSGSVLGESWKLFLFNKLLEYLHYFWNVWINILVLNLIKWTIRQIQANIVTETTTVWPV